MTKYKKKKKYARKHVLKCKTSNIRGRTKDTRKCIKIKTVKKGKSHIRIPLSLKVQLKKETQAERVMYRDGLAIPTCTLKEMLKTKPLTFLLPGQETGNYAIRTINYNYRSYDPKSKKSIEKPLHLRVTVLPKVGDEFEHRVIVNGVMQRRLIYGTFLYKAWIKLPNEVNQWWRDFNQDWRWLLGLNDPEPSPCGYDFLWQYLLEPTSVEDKKRNTQHTTGKWPNHQIPIAPRKQVFIGEGEKIFITKDGKPYTKKVKIYAWMDNPAKPAEKKKQIPKLNRPNRPDVKKKKKEKLVCVKDLNTGEIERITKSEALKLVTTGSHYDYCKKVEWKKYHNIDLAEKDLYWSDKPFSTKDEEGNEIVTNSFIPKVEQKKVLPLKYVTINKKLVGIDKPIKHRSTPLYDRHSKRQIIEVEPQVENIRYEPIKSGKKYHGEMEIADTQAEKVECKIQIPKYAYLKNSEGKIYKKIFVELVDKIETFYRYPRITYKTIITKQYPSELCERRRIIKKNMKLLQEQQEKEKQTEKQQKESKTNSA